MIGRDNSQTDAPPIYDNSFYRRELIRPLAKRIAPFLAGAGFSGNGVCWLKFAVGLVGAVMLSSRSPVVCFLGMLGLQLNFLLDAADGEVARLQGEASLLSGEYIDKIFDHFPKTAMYFFWGYGTFRLTGSHIPLFCGMFLAGWNIYPRFCAVETLLERLDKAPEIYRNPAFHQAVRKSFVVQKDRGRADFFLTVLIHPSMNVLTIFYLAEIFYPAVLLSGIPLNTRFLLLCVFTAAGAVNLVRKGVRFFRVLYF